MADWLQNFPTLDEGALRALKKSFDAGYRAFSRRYGDPIEGFFDPFLKAGAAIWASRFWSAVETLA